MRALAAIPRRMLPDTCEVFTPAGDGVFAGPVVLNGVRFERVQSVVDDGHRGADAGAGTLFIDAVNTDGAFEVPAGSRVEIGGRSLFVRSVSRYEGAGGRVHHWEVELA